MGGGVPGVFARFLLSGPLSPATIKNFLFIPCLLLFPIHPEGLSIRSDFFYLRHRFVPENPLCLYLFVKIPFLSYKMFQGPALAHQSINIRQIHTQSLSIFQSFLWIFAQLSLTRAFQYKLATFEAQPSILCSVFHYFSFSDVTSPKKLHP